MYVLCQLTFIGKTVVTGSDGKKSGGGVRWGKKKNEAMTGYILIVTYLPLYRLLGALLYPTYPITTQSFPRQEKKIC